MKKEAYENLIRFVVIIVACVIGSLLYITLLNLISNAQHPDKADKSVQYLGLSLTIFAGIIAVIWRLTNQRIDSKADRGETATNIESIKEEMNKKADRDTVDTRFNGLGEHIMQLEGFRDRRAHV